MVGLFIQQPFNIMTALNKWYLQSIPVISVVTPSLGSHDHSLGTWHPLYDYITANCNHMITMPDNPFQLPTGSHWGRQQEVRSHGLVRCSFTNLHRPY